MRDITNLMLFSRVIKAGSISAAARDLGMPKSTLSRRLTDLEQDQGVKLLHRGTRQLTLTDVGRAFLVHCQAIDAAAEAASEVTKHLLETPRGTIKVSCPYAISQSLMARFLPEFMRQYPEVKVHLLATNRPVNLIEEGVDVALRVRSSIEDSAFIARPISPAPTTLYASPAFIADKAAIEHPLDLIDAATLSLQYSSGRYTYTLTNAQGEQIQVTHQPKLITDDMWVLREAALAGQGIAALPDYLCKEQLRQGRLVRVLPDWNLPTGVMHLVYTQRQGLLPAVRVFVDYLLDTLPAAATADGYLNPPSS